MCFLGQIHWFFPHIKSKDTVSSSLAVLIQTCQFSYPRVISFRIPRSHWWGACPHDLGSLEAWPHPILGGGMSCPGAFHGEPYSSHFLFSHNSTAAWGVGGVDLLGRSEFHLVTELCLCSPSHNRSQSGLLFSSYLPFLLRTEGDLFIIFWDICGSLAFWGPLYHLPYLQLTSHMGISSLRTWIQFLKLSPSNSSVAPQNSFSIQL